MVSETIEVFFSYAHADESLRDELAKHLAPMKRKGVIKTWHDRKITPGSEWSGEIDEYLDRSQIILLLISPDFMDSDYCNDVELKRAMERHEAGEAVVIPIILRPIDWQESVFGKLQALPKDAKPIINWKNQDDAFLDVIGGIKNAMQKMGATNLVEAVTSPLEIKAERLDHKSDKPPELTQASYTADEIDAVVQQVRLNCGKKVQRLYSEVRLINMRQIEVEQLYVDVYVLAQPSSQNPFRLSRLLDLFKSKSQNQPPQSDLVQPSSQNPFRLSHLLGFFKSKPQDQSSMQSNLLNSFKQREDFDRLGLTQHLQRQPGFEVADKSPRLMLLGKPGSGKTTFLKHLAVACSKQQFQANRIPVMLVFRDIPENQFNSFNLLSLIEQELELDNVSLTQILLTQGKLLILLDGLDEVPTQWRQAVQDKIDQFAKRYYDNHFIITCRTQAAEYSLRGFAHIEVADFNSEQVEAFANQWFKVSIASPADATDRAIRFMEELRQNRTIAELAVTPILLSLTCLVFELNYSLPTKRSELYKDGLDLLLENWDTVQDSTRDDRSAVYQERFAKDKADLKQLLGMLALRKFEQPENFILYEQDEIVQYIAEYLSISESDSESVLKAIEAQHGLLIERAKQIWSFSHLTIQEYFVAQHCLAIPNGLNTLTEHTVKELRWREVFLLAMEMHQPVNELMQLTKKKVDELLVTDSQLQKFLHWVEQKARSLDTPYKSVAIRAFYFASACTCTLDGYDGFIRALDTTLDTRKDLVHKFDQAFDKAFASIPAHLREHFRNKALDRSLAFLEGQLDTLPISNSQLDDELRRAIEGKLGSMRNNDDQAPAPALILALDKTLAHTYALACSYTSVTALDFAYARKVTREGGRSPLTSVYIQNHNDAHTRKYFRDLDETLYRAYIYARADLRLRERLKQLKEQLPNSSTSGRKDLQRWWEAKGQTWIEELRTVMIEHRNIGHDWQFNKEQNNLLKQYYNANRFLVECLQLSNIVSSAVQQEIEELLLLDPKVAKL